MGGGIPQRIVEGNSATSSFSPDGNLVVVTASGDAAATGSTYHLQTFDLRTGKISVVPSSKGLVGAEWITQDTLVAATEDQKKFRVFDFKTQKWSDLVTGDFVDRNMSQDHKYFYFTTGGEEPKAQRLRVADREIEIITSLKNLRRVVDSVEQNSQVNVAPDGSPVFTRDISTQEIYALSVRWP